MKDKLCPCFGKLSELRYRIQKEEQVLGGKEGKFGFENYKFESTATPP